MTPILAGDNTAEGNLTLAREYTTEIYQEKRYENLPKYVSRSHVLRTPSKPEPVRGREALEAHLREFEAAAPDYRVELTSVVADDDRIAAEWVMTGTHAGPLDGVPATGRRFELPGMSMLRVEDGRVVEDTQYWDTAAMRAQLGLTFPAIVPQLPRLVRGKLEQYR